jgi:hypothetical protein
LRETLCFDVVHGHKIIGEDGDLEYLKAATIAACFAELDRLEQEEKDNGCGVCK